MPIYAYRCENCGFQQDVLQKMSAPLLVNCPSCGEPQFRKQVTAAGFQLKGSGWYVTDFRNPATKEAAKSGASEGGSGDGDKKPEAAPAESKSTSADSAAPAPAPAAPSNDAKAEARPSKTPAPSSGST
jgi:putative FmdB family regulatory protein